MRVTLPRLLAAALLGCLLALAASLAAADPVDFADRMARIETAMEAGEGALAMDLMCEEPLFPCGRAAAELSQARLLGFLGACVDFQHARYAEHFTPPANVDSLFGGCRSALPFRRFSVTSSAFGGMWSDEERGVYGVSERGAHGHLTILHEGHPRVSVDLDLDGEAEITYDGDEPDISESLTVAVDRAPDGRRAQWLIAAAGADPRRAPHVWLYRDGAAFFALVDADGDGHGACARGTVVR